MTVEHAHGQTEPITRWSIFYQYQSIEVGVPPELPSFFTDCPISRISPASPLASLFRVFVLRCARIWPLLYNAVKLNIYLNSIGGATYLSTFKLTVKNVRISYCERLILIAISYCRWFLVTLKDHFIYWKPLKFRLFRNQDSLHEEIITLHYVEIRKKERVVPTNTNNANRHKTGLKIMCRVAIVARGLYKKEAYTYFTKNMHRRP